MPYVHIHARSPRQVGPRPLILRIVSYQVDEGHEAVGMCPCGFSPFEDC